MSYYSRSISRAFLSLFLCIFLAACGTIQLAGYDQKAYENATTLKPETLALIQKSRTSNSYSAHAEKLDAHFVKLEAAYEYANGVNHNNEAASNWRDLISDILRNWRDTWEAQQQLSPIASTEMKDQVSAAFDTIICLEANKRQLTKCLEGSPDQ